MFRSAKRFAILCLLAAASARAEVPAGMQSFLEDRCMQCHDADTKKGGLDLDALGFDLQDAKTFAA